MRSHWLPYGLIGCAGIVIGAVFVSFWGQHSPIGQAPAPQPSAIESPVAANRVDSAVIDSRIRQIIREELARHDATRTANPVPPAPSAAISAVASTEVLVQTARANAVLDAATTRLAWTEGDASEFRDAIATLPAAERQTLLLKFAEAVNDRGMRLETGGAPF